jgi:hypothetical protein
MDAVTELLPLNTLSAFILKQDSVEARHRTTADVFYDTWIPVISDYFGDGGVTENPTLQPNGSQF